MAMALSEAASGELRAAAAATVTTLLRCALSTSLSMADAQRTASELLTASGLPDSLKAVTGRLGPPFITRLSRTLQAAFAASSHEEAHADAGADAVSSGATVGGAGGAAGGGTDTLSKLAAEAKQAILAMRPAASAASRAALARLGQAQSAEDDAREFATAATGLQALAALLPLAAAPLPAADTAALMDQCMKIDDARQNAKDGHGAVASLRGALCEALGSLVQTSDGGVRGQLVEHAAWMLALMEAHLRAAVRERERHHCPPPHSCSC